MNRKSILIAIVVGMALASRPQVQIKKRSSFTAAKLPTASVR